MHLSKGSIVLLIVAMAQSICAIAHAQVLDSRQRELLIKQRNLWRPVITEIYQEQVKALNSEERQKLGDARVFFSLDYYFRTFRAIQSPPSKRGIHLGIGDLSHLMELSTAWILGSEHNDVNEYGWAPSYAILLRGTRLEYHANGRIKKDIPQVLHVMGISPNEVSQEQLRQITVLQENTIRFFMAHELGHLVHGHLFARRMDENGDPEDFDGWMRRSRRQEREADRFALNILLRTKQPPLGVMSVFGLWLMYELDETDAPLSRTHPPTQYRMRDIFEFTLEHSEQFGLDREMRKELERLSRGISLLVKLLDTDREEVVRDWNVMAASLRVEDLRVHP